MTKKVCIVGSGFIGKAWAIAFARAEFNVVLYDGMDGVAQRVIDTIDDDLSALAGHGLLNGQTPEAVRARLSSAATLPAAVAGATYIQENTPEILDLKRQVFRDIDAHADRDAIIGSSTSALLPSQFTEHLLGAHRCLVVHPINPPHLVPAVEIVPAARTSQATVARAEAMMRAIGQSPIVMRREIDGFVVNRLQGALLQEAFRLYAEGYASADDIDVAVRDGLGLRWSFMGPFETIDLNAPAGIADYIGRYEDMYARMSASTPIANWSAVAKTLDEEASQRCARVDLPSRQKWRDRRLMALLAHKVTVNKEVGK